MNERVPAIKVLLLPKDTNQLGTIFGGVILSHVDLASAVEARKSGAHRFVTKAMREVEFLAPVFVGDIVNFYTETRRVGRTSVTVGVTVEAERWGAGAGERVKVTEAEVVTWPSEPTVNQCQWRQMPRITRDLSLCADTFY